MAGRLQTILGHIGNNETVSIVSFCVAMWQSVLTDAFLLISVTDRTLKSLLWFDFLFASYFIVLWFTCVSSR